MPDALREIERLWNRYRHSCYRLSRLKAKRLGSKAYIVAFRRAEQYYSDYFMAVSPFSSIQPNPKLH